MAQSQQPPARPAPTQRGAAAPASSHEGEGIRLSKQLADQGLASRREADEWIEAGWVKVDGRVAVLGQRVLPHQRVEIDPAAHRSQAQRVTILLHKPIGYVSGQAEDGYEPASVLVTPANHWSGDGSRIAFHPGHLRGLAPAGRLDIDSTGLLVLTQDGRIAKLLIGEDSRVEKEYLVRVEPMAEGSVKPDALALLNHGLWLDDQPLKPAKVSWQNEHQLRFVLREGRKRQIRRMCELVGYKVTALRRVRIGSITLGGLPQGQWRYLGPHEKFI
jgi:23S rRNA pseudouridine2604 synthase